MNLLVDLVDEADAGREVVAVGLDQAAVLQRAVFGLYDAAAARGVEVELVVLRLQRRGDEVVAQPQVQGELRVHLPVVLGEEHAGVVALVGGEYVRELEVRDVAQQEVGHGVAGEPVAELEVPARGRHVHVLVLHEDDVGADLQGMAALEPGERVEQLVLVRVLELREEVRRAETAEARALEERVDLDSGEAARDQRIGDGPRDDGGARHGLAERLLDRVRGGLLPVQAQLVDDRRAEDACPAEHHAVALDRLVAEGRRPRPVEDAPEGAGDVALAVQ
jgi:hypothetical protein